MELQSDFLQFKGFIFDCDGVIWEGKKLLPGAISLIKTLESLEKSVGFVTNNSTLSTANYLKKFSDLGLFIDKNQLVTSTQAVIHYLNSLNPSILNIYVIGEAGLIDSIHSAGYNISEDPKIIDAVVVGMDRQFTYNKLRIGLRSILNGARFIGTNPDPQFPTEDGFSPGAGSMIGALARALEQEPEEILGKPNPLMAEILLKQLNLSPKSCVMIGDRVSTDLKFALNAKMTPVLVKTGFGKGEFNKNKNFPYYKVIDTLEQIFR